MSLKFTLLPSRQVSLATRGQKFPSKRYVIALAACALCGTALADGPDVRLSGFGTVGVTHTKEHDADFVSTGFQPNGVGRTRAVSLAPDTKLGGQMNVNFNDKFSGVVQVLMKHQYDNSYVPNVEWANIKYQATPDLSVRIGRGPLPVFMVSETTFVGYSNPWVRVPVEVYGIYPITSNDGIDVTYRSRLGSVNNTTQAYYGNSNTKTGGTKIKARPAWGINDTVEFGSLSMRASYNSVSLDLDSPQIQTLVSFLPANLAEKYSTQNTELTMLAFGATYDPGNWFVTGEFINLKGDNYTSDGRGWYITGGYRIGKFTPYVTHSSVKPDFQTEPGAGPIIAGVNAIKRAVSPSQTSNSVGLRWDFRKNMSLKGQFDRIETGDSSTGHFANVQPGFRPGDKVNLLSVALDFVF
jgi:hypothetical protein